MGLNEVVASYSFLTVALWMACISHHFLFQVTNSSMESVDTGKFIDLYHLLLKRQKRIWPLGLNPSLKAYCVHSLTFTLPLAPIPPSSSLYGKWHSSGLIYTHTPRGKKGSLFRTWIWKLHIGVTTWLICPSPIPFNIGKDKQNTQLSIH